MTDTPLYIDSRDEAVISQLEAGKTYDVTHIKNLYKSHTDICRDSTAEQRKRTLLNTPCFECVFVGRFRYLGVDDDE